MKKLLSIILTAAMLIGSFCYTSFAAELPIIDIGTSIKVGAVTVDNAYAGTGYKVKITASVTGSATIKNVSMKLTNGTDSKTLSMTYNSTSKVYQCTFSVDNSTKLGTWTTQSVTASDETITISSKKTITVVQLGDVSSDGEINSTDALFVLRSVVGSVTLTDAQKCAANVDRNNKISSYDALLILMYCVGEIDEF